MFDVTDELWSTVTVLHPHRTLHGYAGWYVAWRWGGVHVSAPSTASAHEVAALTTGRAATLQDPTFWQAFAHGRGFEVVGPSTHLYLDSDVDASLLSEASSAVVPLDTEQLDRLSSRVRAQDWDEGGMGHRPAPTIAVGVLDEDDVVAAAVLNPWRDVPSDIGVVVADSHRGRGLGTTVAAHATSYAVRKHAIARWRAATRNVASMQIARRLGFEPYATQLALRPGPGAVSGSSRA